MDAVDFMRKILSVRPWQPKATTLNELARGYKAEKYGSDSPLTDEDRAIIRAAIEELQRNSEIRIMAGLGWAEGDVDFIFKAVA